MVKFEESGSSHVNREEHSRPSLQSRTEKAEETSGRPRPACFTRSPAGRMLLDTNSGDLKTRRWRCSRLSGLELICTASTFSFADKHHRQAASTIVAFLWQIRATPRVWRGIKGLRRQCRAAGAEWDATPTHGEKEAALERLQTGELKLQTPQTNPALGLFLQPRPLRRGGGSSKAKTTLLQIMARAKSLRGEAPPEPRTPPAACKAIISCRRSMQAGA